MRTYWLAGRAGEDRTRRFCDDVKHDNSKILEKKANQHSSYDLHGMLASNSYGQFMDFKKRDSLQDTGQLGKSMSQSEDAGSQDDSSESSGFASDTKQHAIDKDNTIPVSFEIGSNRSSIKGSDPSFDIDSPRLVLKGSDVFEVGSPKTSQMRDVLLDIDGPNKPHVCDVSFEIGSPKRSKATDAALKDDSPKTDLIEPPLELHRTLNDISDSFLDISISKAGNAVQDISDIDTGEPVETEASEVYEIESPQLTSPISIDMSEDELGQFPDETIDRVFVNDDEQICSCLNQGDIKFEFPKTTWELHKGIRHIEIDNKEYEDALMEPPHLPHVLGNLCPLPHTHYSRMPPIEELAQSATAEIQSQKEEPKVGKEDINHHNQYSTGGKHSLVPATETDMYNEDSTRLDSNTDKIHNSDSSTMCPCGNPNEAENDGGTDFSQSQPCQCINDDRTRETRRRSNNTTQHSTADEVLSSLTNGDIFNNTSEINRNYTAVAKPCLTRVPNECVNGHNQGLDCCPHMENLGLDMSRKMRDWQGKGLQFRLSLTDDIDDD